MSSVLLSLSLSMFAVAQALTSLIHDCIEWSSSDILSGGADICNCKSSANEWCMIECESIMADKGLIYMVKSIYGQELKPDVTSHLQRIQNYAARVILRLSISSSITIHLKSLHWLPVKVRSTYKIACLCYHCHSSTAPSYVTDMLHRKPLHTRNTRSSSYTMPLLNRPAHSKATLGDRSFSFASSSVWNSIPNDVRCAPSLSSFKSRLKTYLFRSVYIDWTVSLITVHMCMFWPCYCFVDGLS